MPARDAELFTGTLFLTPKQQSQTTECIFIPRDLHYYCYHTRHDYILVTFRFNNGDQSIPHALTYLYTGPYTQPTPPFQMNLGLLPPLVLKENLWQQLTHKGSLPSAVR